MSGCSAVWLAHFLGVEEVAGSSPVTPTIVLSHYSVISSLKNWTGVIAGIHFSLLYINCGKYCWNSEFIC